eukprot:270355_1
MMDNETNVNDNHQFKQNHNEANGKKYVGLSKESMYTLRKTKPRYDQRQLTRQERLDSRFKDYTQCYIMGIPIDECDKYKLAKKFTVCPYQVRFHRKEREEWMTYDCCYIKFDDKKQCKKLIQAINANEYNYYYGWKIKASYGLLKYCERWVNGQHCHNNKCGKLHEFCRNFSRKEIHTQEMERKMREKPCGDQTVYHYDHDDTYFNGNAPSDFYGYGDRYGIWNRYGAKNRYDVVNRYGTENENEGGKDTVSNNNWSSITSNSKGGEKLSKSKRRKQRRLKARKGAN